MSATPTACCAGVRLPTCNIDGGRDVARFVVTVLAISLSLIGASLSLDWLLWGPLVFGMGMVVGQLVEAIDVKTARRGQEP